PTTFPYTTLFRSSAYNLTIKKAQFFNPLLIMAPLKTYPCQQHLSTSLDAHHPAPIRQDNDLNERHPAGFALRECGPSKAMTPCYSRYASRDCGHGRQHDNSTTCNDGARD